MHAQQVDRIRTSFKELLPLREPFADAFFANLLGRAPELRPLFPTDSLQRSQDLLGVLGTLVKNLHRLHAIEHMILELGARNSRAGVQPQHYGVARAAFIAALRTTLGEEFSEELEADWSETLSVVSSLLVLGAGRARARAA